MKPSTWRTLTRLEKVEVATICLDRMNEDERKLFIERFVDEKTLRTLADARDVHPETIRNRLTNASEKAKAFYKLVAKIDGLNL